MDLTWPEDLERYRVELRAWLTESLRGRSFPEIRRPETIQPLRDWEALLYSAGLSAVSWPAEFGGAAFDPLRSAVFYEEYIRSGAPDRLNRQAMTLAAPTLMALGTKEQQDRWLNGILTCDDIMCQGFSEPDAGSDLASIRTRAVRDGDDYVVTGQKIWASNGPIANWTFALVRTDPDAPKHNGITYLMIDLTSPGVEVRPIGQVNGKGDFAELFFTDVRVPVANRIGDENEGWRVAMTTLSIERGTGAANAAAMAGLVDDVEIILRATGSFDDSSLRSEFVRLKTEVRRYRLNAYAMLSSDRRETAGSLGAVHKVTWSSLQVALYELGMSALGRDVELGTACVPGGVVRWHERYWLARASLIYSGTNQIQRNIISERMLGLPKETVSA